MPRLPRFGAALSALALAGVLAGCATPTARQGLKSNIDKSDIGLAMRAQFALASGEFEQAIQLAERAVELKPRDAAMRALLGNVYFGAGRFASAEAAYRDTLSLVTSEPKIVLKLALVQIAQGKGHEAVAFLHSARHHLQPADLGLALALAGQPAEAVSVLEPAARMPGADSRVRQNLALALGLSGDWTAARAVAAQDVAPDQVDQRVRQWMALAQPARASDQVAAIVGVRPAQVDPGQPQRLALRDTGERFAQATVPAPVSVPAPAPAQMQASLPAPAPKQASLPAPAYASAPLALPAAEPLPVLPAHEVPVMSAAFEAPEVETLVAANASAPAETPPPLVAALGPKIDAPVRAKMLHTKAKAKVRAESASKAESRSAGIVVQLGAFSSPDRVEAAWDQFADRYASLKDYVPTSASFDSAKGKVYRLSVRGFGSLGEAKNFCETLQTKGKSCFVRSVAGDSPVRFASR